MVKTGLNVGSGQRPFVSTGDMTWINVDAQERWSPDIVARAEDLPMIADQSVDLVVAHHVLEHYGCGDGAGLIREAFRVLKPWGSLIICVPDMWELAKMFLSGELDDETYLINVYGAYMEDEMDRHKFGFVRRTLQTELQASAEWRAVVPFDFRPIPGADIARAKWVLAMEALR